MLPESGSRPFFLLQLPKRAVPESQQRAAEDKRHPQSNEQSEQILFNSILWVSLIASKMSSLTTGQRLATRTQQQQNRSCEYPNITTSIQQGIAAQSGRRAQLAITSQSVIPGAQHQGRVKLSNGLSLHQEQQPRNVHSATHAN